MQRSQSVILSSLILALASPLVLGGTPRYALRVGEKIEYRRVARFENGNALDLHIHLCVLEDLRDAWRVLAICESPDGDVRSVGYFNVTGRGEVQLPDEIRRRYEAIEPALEILPALPPVIGDTTAWNGPADEFGRELRFRITATQPGSTQFRFSRVDPIGEALRAGSSAEGSYWFDESTDLISRWQSRQIAGTAGTQIEILGELSDRSEMPPAAFDRLKKEADHLAQVFRVEDALTNEITAHPMKIEATLSRFERIWSEFLALPPRNDITPLRRFAFDQRQNVAARAPSRRDQARLASQWLYKPAAEWSLQDLNGRTVTSESVRKGITLECFWSTAVPASLRMFIVLDRLSRERPKTPVSVVFLNVDSDMAAARNAAAACRISSPVVFAGPPMEGHPPETLPIVRVLDAKGLVRQVIVGWRPTLADVIDEVLK